MTWLAKWLPEDLGLGRSAQRKVARLEQRELLYSVIHETMLRVGVLSSNYHYKVLSLDSRGRQYLIMMDLLHAIAPPSPPMWQIEALIVKAAKNRCGIRVTSVYWRIKDHAEVDLSGQATTVCPTEGFQDTELFDPTGRRLPLGGIQHG